MEPGWRRQGEPPACSWLLMAWRRPPRSPSLPGPGSPAGTNWATLGSSRPRPGLETGTVESLQSRCSGPGASLRRLEDPGKRCIMPAQRARFPPCKRIHTGPRGPPDTNQPWQIELWKWNPVGSSDLGAHCSSARSGGKLSDRVTKSGKCTRAWRLWIQGTVLCSCQKPG